MGPHYQVSTFTLRHAYGTQAERTAYDQPLKNDL